MYIYIYIYVWIDIYIYVDIYICRYIYIYPCMYTRVAFSSPVLHLPLGLYWGYIRGNIGIMEKKMESTGIIGLIYNKRQVQPFCRLHMWSEKIFGLREFGNDIPLGFRV